MKIEINEEDKTKAEEILAWLKNRGYDAKRVATPKKKS